MSARSRARKRALDVLFEADQRHTDLHELLKERVERPGAQTELPPYAREVIAGVAEQQERIDEVIDTYAVDWTRERMPAVDLAILRAGVWEILYNPDVPDTVALSEAVALAKDLSTDSSPKFINGLLGRIVELKEMLIA